MANSRFGLRTRAGTIRAYMEGLVGGDPDAIAFLSAANITDTTITLAINDLVIGLKNNSLWTKMKAIYPFVGGSALSHKWNLIDPRDIDGAFRLVFNGGWTHSSNGIITNGTNTYAETYLNDDTTLSLNSAHLSIYSRTNSDGLFCDIGCADGNNEINIFTKYNNVFYPRVHNTNNGVSNTISSQGFFITNRVSSTEIRGMQTGTLKTITNSSVQKASRTIIIGALRRTSDIGFYTNRNYAFASIGDGLTDNDMTNLTNLVNSFQTTLGRQV